MWYDISTDHWVVAVAQCWMISNQIIGMLLFTAGESACWVWAAVGAREPECVLLLHPSFHEGEAPQWGVEEATEQGVYVHACVCVCMWMHLCMEGLTVEAFVCGEAVL